MNRNHNPASEVRTRRRRRAFRARIASCLPCLLAAAPAFAAQWNYVGPDAGLWLVPNNWQLSVFPFIPGFPNNGDNAVLGMNTNSPVQSLTLNYSYSSPGLNSLTINAQTVFSFTLNQGAGSDMFATNEYLGTTTYGAIFNQTGGTNTAASLFIGSGTGTNPQGNYILSGTGLLTAGTEQVGVNPAVFVGGNQFNQSGGTNNANTLTVGGGTNGTGIYTFSGGANTVSSSLIVGDQAGSLGAYTMNNAAATLTVNGAEYVGNIATGNVTQPGGTFNQSAGSHSVTNGLLVGFVTGSSGSFSLSGGTLTVGLMSGQFPANSEYIGYGGTGNFTQTGGTHIIGAPAAHQALYVGYNAFAIGTFTLNDTSGPATLIVNGSEFVGYDATGTSSGGAIPKYGGAFSQTSGVHTVTVSLTLGHDPGATGSFTLSGGTLAVGTAAGGTNSPEYIGESGIGAFTQTGGTFTIGTPAATQFLVVGTNGTALGTYTLNNAAATLTVNGAEIVGGAATGTVTQRGGTFTQTAGTHTATGGLRMATAPGGTALFALSGGSLTVGTAGPAGTALEYVGYLGNATFTQTGGSHTLGTPAANQNLFLAFNAGASGTYTMNNPAATLTVNGDAYLGGSSTAAGGVGVLNLSAGNATVTGNLKIWPTAGTALNLSGGVLTLGSLDLSANPSALNWTAGTLTLTGGGAGTTSFATGLSVGSAAGNNCTLNLQGGNLTVGSTGGPGASPEYIGESGIGAFTQSGGTHTVGTPAVIQLLALGYLPGANGAYTMNNAAATLTVNGDEAVGYSATATGAFIQTAGSHTVMGHEQIGYLQGSTGSFALTGGSLVVGPATSGAFSSGEFIGYSGTGTFTQSGGSNTIGTPTTQEALNLGETSTAIGTYALTGAAATLTVNGDENIGGIGTGIFAQAGGSHTIGTLAVNHSLFVGAYSSSANGTYTMSNLAATLTVNGNAYFGGNDLAAGGVGVLNLLGGAATITGSLTVWNTLGSIVNLSGGSLHLASANNMQSFIQSPGNSLFVTTTFTNSGTASFAGAQFWSPNAAFTNTAGAASFLTDTGSTVASPLNINITGGLVNLSATQHLSSLVISTGKAAITTGTTKTNALALGGATNAWTGTLDIGANKLVVESTTLSKPSLLNTLQNEIFFGITHTTGITSAVLPAHMALAVIDNGALATPFTTFGGVAVGTNSLLLAPELLGDTNIDGHVDLTDLSTLLNNFGATTASWTSGNFDGATIDLTDLSDVLNNFGLTNPNANASAQLPMTTYLLLTTLAPEPNTALLLAIAPCLLFLTRRRSFLS